MLLNLVQMVARAAEPLAPDELSANERTMLLRVKQSRAFFHEEAHDNCVMSVMNGSGALTRAFVNHKLSCLHWWGSGDRLEHLKHMMQLSYGRVSSRTADYLESADCKIDFEPAPVERCTAIHNLNHKIIEGVAVRSLQTVHSIRDAADRKYQSLLRSDDHRGAEVRALLDDLKGLEVKLNYMAYRKRNNVVHSAFESHNEYRLAS